MAEPQIRRASPEDIQVLIPLYIEFHEFHVLGVPKRLRVPEHYDIPLIQSTLADMIQRPNVGLFVAELHGQIIGFVEVYLNEDPPDDAVVSHYFGYVQSLMVAARYRKGGVGHALLGAAKTWAMSQGATQLRLDIWEFADGPLPFYERLGFQTVKRMMAIDMKQEKW